MFGHCGPGGLDPAPERSHFIAVPLSGDSAGGDVEACNKTFQPQLIAGKAVLGDPPLSWRPQTRAVPEQALAGAGCPCSPRRPVSPRCPSLRVGWLRGARAGRAASEGLRRTGRSRGLATAPTPGQVSGVWGRAAGAPQTRGQPSARADTQQRA